MKRAVPPGHGCPARSRRGRRSSCSPSSTATDVVDRSASTAAAVRARARRGRPDPGPAPRAAGGARPRASATASAARRSSSIRRSPTPTRTTSTLRRGVRPGRDRRPIPTSSWCSPAARARREEAVRGRDRRARARRPGRAAPGRIPRPTSTCCSARPRRWCSRRATRGSASPCSRRWRRGVPGDRRRRRRRCPRSSATPACWSIRDDPDGVGARDAATCSTTPSRRAGLVAPRRRAGPPTSRWPDAADALVDGLRSARPGVRRADRPPRERSMNIARALPALRARRGADRRGDDEHRRRAGRAAATGCTSSRRCRGTSATPSSRGGTASSSATRTPPWGRITRVHPFPTDKRNIPARAVAFGGFTVLASVEAARHRDPARRRARHVAAADRSVWPAGPWPRPAGCRSCSTSRTCSPTWPSSSGCSPSRRVIAAASWLERFTYRRADAVTVLSDDLADNVRAKITRARPRAAERQAAKVRVIPNFIDTEWIRPGDRENALPGRARPDRAHGRHVRRQRRASRSRSTWCSTPPRARATSPTWCSSINGGGRGPARARAAAAGLDNVRFVDMQPEERLPEVLAAADVHVVPLKRGLARSSVPSKLYSILAAGRPIVASVDLGHRGGPHRRAGRCRRGGRPRTTPRRSPRRCGRCSTSPRRRRDDGRDRAGRFVERWASPAAVGGRVRRPVRGAERRGAVHALTEPGPSARSARGSQAATSGPPYG